MSILTCSPSPLMNLKSGRAATANSGASNDGPPPGLLRLEKFPASPRLHRLLNCITSPQLIVTNSQLIAERTGLVSVFRIPGTVPEPRYCQNGKRLSRRLFRCRPSGPHCRQSSKRENEVEIRTTRTTIPQTLRRDLLLLPDPMDVRLLLPQNVRES
jgi:hypothetical protein